MNINNFFKSLTYLQSDYLPNKNFPDAHYINKYMNKEAIIEAGLTPNETDKMYLIYCCDDEIKHCIGIDEEMDYINKLNCVKIAVPRSKRFNIELALHEAFVLFDFFYKEQDNTYFDVKFMANLNVLNSLYSLRKGLINDFKYSLLLTAFKNNPIKKDICFAQFNYFVKRYVEFRLKMDNTNEIHLLSLNTFNLKLRNALSNYCSITKSDEENFEEILLDKLFRDLIIDNLKMV